MNDHYSAGWKREHSWWIPLRLVLMFLSGFAFGWWLTHYALKHAILDIGSVSSDGRGVAALVVVVEDEIWVGQLDVTCPSANRHPSHREGL